MGDLATLLNWHRNDPPVDFEMNRNNVVYTWQLNRKPLIDYPDLVEYIWGANTGDVWNQPLSIDPAEISTVEVYPNPTNGRIYLKGITDSTTIDVYSIEGRHISNYNIERSSYIDLNLAIGM